MSEHLRPYSQAEQDAMMGLPVQMQGACTLEAQLMRMNCLIEDGVSEEEAIERLGLRGIIQEDFSSEVV
jgi:hypothetical protein